MAFKKKLIDVQFNLAQGVFSGGGNTATISGARVTCEARYPGGSDQGTCELGIYGLPLSLMNQLSTTGTQINQASHNKLAVFAYEEGAQPSVIFQGTIVSAMVDATGMPNVVFRVVGAPGNYQAVKPAKPLSIKGSADVSGMLSNIAKQMGLQFEDAGVNVKLSNPYYGGSLWTQALAIARHANIDITFDRGTMVIVPPGKSRAGDPVLISKDTGMVGYPGFNQASVIVTALFNPAVKHFGQVKIQSDLTSANGTWKVANYTLDLESQVPRGRWFMILECVDGKSGTP